MAALPIALEQAIGLQDERTREVPEPVVFHLCSASLLMFEDFEGGWLVR